MVFCFDGNSSFAVFENLNRMGYLSELLISPPAGGIWGSGTPGSSKNVHFCDACSSQNPSLLYPLWWKLWDGALSAMLPEVLPFHWLLRAQCVELRANRPC